MLSSQQPLSWVCKSNMLEPTSFKMTSHIKYPGWSYDHITSLFLRILFNPKLCDSSTKRGVNFTCVAGEATHPRGQSRYSLRPSVKMLRLNNTMKNKHPWQYSNGLFWSFLLESSCFSRSWAIYFDPGVFESLWMSHIPARSGSPSARARFA